MAVSLTQLQSVDVGTQFGNTNITSVASNADGTKLYAVFNNSPPATVPALITSTNGGVSWSGITTIPDLSGGYITSVTCNSTGTIVYVAKQYFGLYKSIDSGVNWTLLSITGFAQGGETQVDITQIASNAAGTTLILSTTYGLNVYSLTGSTVTSLYTIPTASPSFNVASNADGTALFASFTGVSGPGVYNATSGWVISVLNIVNSPLSCDSTGNILFVQQTGVGLYIFIISPFTVVTITSYPNTSTLSAYSTGTRLLASDINGFISTYSIDYNAPVVCFGKGTQILCSKDGQEVYRPIEEIRPGDLVKTSLNGFVPVYMIGHSTLKPQDETTPLEERLYICKPSHYPTLTKDLILTGFHAILVDFITPQDEVEITRVLKKIYVTDRKYRLPVCIDERASLYPETGSHTIWHLALQNSDYYSNYGIYANGLLVETCSKRFIKELSKMTLMV